MDLFNEKKLSQLYTACKNVNQSKESIKWILEGVKDINYFARTTNSKVAGCTPLHFIVEYVKDVKLIELLLNRGADVTIKNKNNQTPLHLAYTYCEKSTDIIDAILSGHKNYAINPVNDQGLSHFHIACWRNNVSVVQNFLQNKVEISVPIKSIDYWPGYMPLHIALKYKNAEVIKLLSQHDSFVDDTGISSFHIACIISDKATVERFLDEGSSINAPISFEAPILAGYTPLHLGIEFNDYEIVELLLNFGANVSLVNADGETPINICKCNQKLKMVIDIVVKKNNLKNNIFPSDVHLSRFLIACKENNAAQIKCLFEQGVTIKSTFTSDSLIWPGYSLLHIAVEIGCDETIIKILLEEGADIALQDANGCTPVHLAICQKNKQIVDLLLSSCSENIDNPSNKRGLSLFHIACMTNNSKVAEQFLQSGVNVNDAIVLDITDIRVQNSELSPKERFIHKAGETALHFAVIRRCHDMVILLLKYGGDVSIKNADGSTPIHLAAQGYFDRNVTDEYYDSSEEDLFYQVFCINYKDNMYILYNLILSQKTGEMNPADSDGLTHFHIACLVNLSSLCKNFIKCNCDVNASVSSTSQNWAGYTPLHFALYRRDFLCETVSLLLDNGANVNATEAQGKTALHLAVEPDLPYHFQYNDDTEDSSNQVNIGQQDLVKLLVNHGADINAKDKDGKTPLQHAVTSSSTKWLLYSLISTDSVDKVKYFDDSRFSLIHIACLRKNFVLLKKCLQQGADANLQIDSRSPFFPGYTPLHFIVGFVLRGGGNFIQLLLKYKADCTIKNAYGLTPLHIAEKNEQVSYINLLLPAQHNKSTINPVNDEGVSHFHIACSNINGAVHVKKFANNGVDINKNVDFFASKWAGYTPLHVACSISSYQKEKFVEIVELLLTYGANINADDSSSLIPIQHTSCGSILFNLLIRHGADVNSRNLNGQSLIEKSIINRNRDDLKTLLKCNANVNSINPVTGLAPIHIEVKNFLKYYFRYDCKNFEREFEKYFIEILLNNGGDVNTKDKNGMSVMHYIFTDDVTYDNKDKIEKKECEKRIYCYKKLISFFVEKGCDINSQDCDGKTPLHVAATSYCPKGVAFKILLDNNANVNIEDKSGKVAVSYVKESVDCIIEYIANLKANNSYVHEQNELWYESWNK